MVKLDLGPHLAPCVVPWTEDYEIDEGALRKHVSYLASVRGMSGVVVNPHAGEVYSLTNDERIRVLEAARSEVGTDGTVVCGLAPSPDSNRAAVEFAKRAEASGADSLLVIAPHWFAFGVNSEPAIAERYFEELLSAVEIPLLVYQLGSWTGAHYSIDTLRTICEMDGVIGVKMVTFDTQEFEDTVVALQSVSAAGNFRIYTGNDNVMLYNYIGGATGTLVGMHNAYAELMIDMYDAVQSGDLSTARKLHDQQFEITRLLFADPPLRYRTRYKAAAKIQGKIPSARLRPPLPEVTPEEEAEIREALVRAELL